MTGTRRVVRALPLVAVGLLLAACDNDVVAPPLPVSPGGQPIIPPPNQLPTSSFVAECEALACTFTNTSTDDGTLTAYRWQFGDNSEATTRDATHTYAGPDWYYVRLTVTDDDGAVSVTAWQLVAVAMETYVPPEAAFTVSCAATTCTFTDQSVGAVSRTWDFGDGTTSGEQHPTHVYYVSAPTQFTVTLTVSDWHLGFGSTSHTITVTPDDSP